VGVEEEAVPEAQRLLEYYPDVDVSVLNDIVSATGNNTELAKKVSRHMRAFSLGPRLSFPGSSAPEEAVPHFTILNRTTTGTL
jgi:hypothetical protein